MPKSYSSIWVHLVWKTRNGLPLLAKQFRYKLNSYIKKNAREHGFIVDTVNGIEDHLHCLARLLPNQRVSDLMKQVKGASSRWINDGNFLDVKFAWTQGYGAFSVCSHDLERVRSYIRNQERHHSNLSLEKELQTLGYIK